MFHTFETAHFASPEAVKSNDSSGKRRTSTVRACEPCRRRKIRCNGEHPCETCQWYRKADSCHYTEPRQRQMPSRRSIEKIAASLQQYRSILQKLFPHIHPDTLADLPRERLLELIAKSSSNAPPSPVTPNLEEKPPHDPEAGSLEQFQPMPEDSNDGSDLVNKDMPGVTDDVNALSLSVKQSSSYLGISSVMAVLRVIVWLDPESQNYFTKTPERSELASREQSSPPESRHLRDLDMAHADPRLEGSSAWDEIPLINAYFTYVHTFIPIIEEQSFRDSYMNGRRSDSRWLLLLNTVLAMGSIAAGTADDTAHKIYYARAKQHLTVDTLGQSHIETVQALAILGGFYLHYLQQPSLANALMGATLRMATTLGLHRDHPEGAPSSPSNRSASSIEIRRRVWWCTFNLDTWSGSTLGRPSMGRNGYAITVQPPQEPIASSPQLLTLFQETIRFCSISTRLEDALAVCPLIPVADLAALDSSLVEWYRTSSVQTSTPRPLQPETNGITVTKNVMRWRYLSSRIILHRPVLLWYAMRRVPFASLSLEKQHAVTICREVTAEVISDIATTWRAQKPSMMSGWNATWLLYQAVMVPLLSLYSDASDDLVLDQSRRQVEIALMTLKDLHSWSPTAKRSAEVISRIYEASKRWSTTISHAYSNPQHFLSQSRVGSPPPPHLSSPYAPSHSTPTFPHLTLPITHPAFRPGIGIDTNLSPTSALSQEMFMDSMFDSLTWSTGWNHLDYPFENTPTNGVWDYGGWTTIGSGGGMGQVGGGFDGYFDGGGQQSGGVGGGGGGDRNQGFTPVNNGQAGQGYGDASAAFEGERAMEDGDEDGDGFAYR